MKKHCSNHTYNYLLKAFLLDHMDSMNISVTLCFNAAVEPIDGAYVVKKWHDKMAKTALGSHYKRYQREDKVVGLYFPEVCPSTAFTTGSGNNGFLHYHGKLRISKNFNLIEEVAEEVWEAYALKAINNQRSNARPTIEFGDDSSGRKWSNYCTKNMKYDKVTLTPLLQDHFVLL